MSNFQAMYQYSEDVVSVIHEKKAIPETGDNAILSWKPNPKYRDIQSNKFEIISVNETRNHKTDPSKMISIVKIALP